MNTQILTLSFRTNLARGNLNFLFLASFTSLATTTITEKSQKAVDEQLMMVIHINYNHD